MSKRGAAMIQSHTDDGLERARPPAPLRGAKARVSEQRFREQDVSAPPPETAPRAPAPLIGAAARTSAARFLAQTSSLAPPSGIHTIAAPPAAAPTLAQPPAAAVPALQTVPPPAPQSPVGTPASTFDVDTRTGAAPSKAATITRMSPLATPPSSAPNASATKPSAATVAAPTVLFQWAAQARAVWRSRIGLAPITPVPLAAVLSAVESSAGVGTAARGGASAGTDVVTGIALAPVLAMTAVTLAAALVISVLLGCAASTAPVRRLTPGSLLLELRLSNADLIDVPDTGANQMVSTALLLAYFVLRTIAVRCYGLCDRHGVVCVCVKAQQRRPEAETVVV